MALPVRVLWALLACAALAGARAGARAPGRPLGPGGGPPRPPPPADANLSCHRCFKAAERAACPPARCRRADRVCVAHITVLRVKHKRRLLLSKDCAPRCPNANSRFRWRPGLFVRGALLRQCCSASLCNGAPARKGGPWAGGAWAGGGLGGGAPLLLLLLPPLGLGLLRAPP